MPEYKQCRLCNRIRSLSEYYVCMGWKRTECKDCTKTINSLYQKKKKVWLTKARLVYNRRYYRKNPEKMARYRRDFRERHPGYHKQYAEKKFDK